MSSMVRLELHNDEIRLPQPQGGSYQYHRAPISLSRQAECPLRRGHDHEVRAAGYLIGTSDDRK